MSWRARSGVTGVKILILRIKMKGKLLFLIGLPRSGKSTIAEKLSHFNGYIGDAHYIPYDIHIINTKGNTKSRAIVCADSIRFNLHGMRWSTVAEPFVAVIKTIMIKSLLDKGVDVIVDGTHTTPKSVEEMFHIDPEAEYCFIYSTSEICKARAVQSLQPDLIPVIERMNQQLQKLNKNIIEDIRLKVKNNPIIPRISIC